MQLDFCAICGSKRNLIQFNIAPSKGITLCEDCEPEIKVVFTPEKHEKLIQHAVKEIFDSMEPGERWRMLDISTMLNERGYRTVRGSEWTVSSTWKILKKLGYFSSTADEPQRDEFMLPVGQLAVNQLPLSSVVVDP